MVSNVYPPPLPFMRKEIVPRDFSPLVFFYINPPHGHLGRY
jgi:hypothetical protein